jgi:myo-inositol-1(or 4)-monophosphatase
MSYLEAAEGIAREAGALLAHYFERRVVAELKSKYDLVTEADRASEALVVERLLARFPSHAIVAEEGGGVENSSAYRWYVDPLDGTSNFAHGFPIFNVTLGLEKNGEMLAGVVFDPVRGEMFTAARGEGAYLNGRRLKVSAVNHLAGSLLSTGFPNRKRSGSYNIHFYYQLAMATHGVRRTGSAAIDLAYVACGRLDGFWEFGLQPWDMAAGRLLVAEAGGRFTDMTGAPHNLRSPHLMADNGLIHDELVEMFAAIFRGDAPASIPAVPPALPEETAL